MKYNERSLEEFKKEHNKRFPDSNLQIISFISSTKVLVKTKFGDCIFPKKTLLRGVEASIKSAINKNEYLINQLKQIYLDKYSYHLVNYTLHHTKIELVCNLHGNFLQRTDHLLNKIGCPKCGRKINSERMKQNPTGWSYSFWEKAGLKSKTFDSFKVYIIECWNEDENFYKIGKTYNTIKRRFEYKGALPYKWKLINLYKGGAREMSELENKLKNINKKHKYIPNIKFSGKQECFIKLETDEVIFAKK
jgi:hypothetical protein